MTQIVPSLAGAQGGVRTRVERDVRRVPPPARPRRGQHARPPRAPGGGSARNPGGFAERPGRATLAMDAAVGRHATPTETPGPRAQVRRGPRPPQGGRDARNGGDRVASPNDATRTRQGARVALRAAGGGTRRVPPGVPARGGTSGDQANETRAGVDEGRGQGGGGGGCRSRGRRSPVVSKAEGSAKNPTRTHGGGARQGDRSARADQAVAPGRRARWSRVGGGSRTPRGGGRRETHGTRRLRRRASRAARGGPVPIRRSSGTLSGPRRRRRARARARSHPRRGRPLEHREGVPAVHPTERRELRGIVVVRPHAATRVADGRVARRRCNGRVPCVLRRYRRRRGQVGDALRPGLGARARVRRGG